MKAIHEARAEKRQIEERLNDLLNEFTRRTGLAIRNIEVGSHEVTSMGDTHPVFEYRCRCEIVLDD